jgi:hypothetical protein
VPHVIAKHDTVGSRQQFKEAGQDRKAANVISIFDSSSLSPKLLN